jgi:nucleoside-diphosphate-sugar epimerase
MIIGNGLLAQAFRPEFSEDENTIIFASGVSNSNEKRVDEFARERTLLEAALAKDKFLVYFSTCSIQDTELVDSAYVQHKISMEKLVLQRAPKVSIFRLPQVVGHTVNPHTLTNFLFRQIDAGLPFQVWLHAKRNLIDVCDAAAIATELLRNGEAAGRVINIACPFSIPVIELVGIFEAVLGKAARYERIAAGASYAIDVAPAMLAAQRLNLPFGVDYIEQLIKKYYAN